MGRPAGETVVLNTCAEQNSNDFPSRFTKSVTLIRMFVDDDGFADLKEMERLLRKRNQGRFHGQFLRQDLRAGMGSNGELKNFTMAPKLRTYLDMAQCFPKKEILIRRFLSAGIEDNKCAPGNTPTCDHLIRSRLIE